MNLRAYNLNQLFRQALNRYPLGCDRYEGKGICDGCKPGEIEQCDRCGVIQPLCRMIDGSCDKCHQPKPIFSIDLRTGKTTIHDQEASDRFAGIGGDRQ